MTKTEQYTADGYLTLDPSDANFSFFTIKIRVANAATDNGAIEAAAVSTGWQATSGVHPCEHLTNWVKNTARTGAAAVMRPQLLAPAIAEVDSILNSML